MAETKDCPKCDAVIGASETKCPKCGADFEELEDLTSSVETALSIIEKRKKRNAPPPPPEPTPAPAAKPKGAARLRAIGNAFRKKGA